MSTHNICFCGKIRKILCRYLLSSGSGSTCVRELILFPQPEKYYMNIPSYNDNSVVVFFKY